MSAVAALAPGITACKHDDESLPRITLQEQSPEVVICGPCYTKFQALVHGFHTETMSAADIAQAVRAMDWLPRRAGRQFVRELRKGGYECRHESCTHYTPVRRWWTPLRRAHGNA